MRRHLVAGLAAAVVPLLAAAGLAFAPGGGKADSQSCLVRPDDGPDDNAKGDVRIRSKGKSERFDVHIVKVEGGDEHHLWLEDPLDSGTFVDLGDLPGKGGSQKLALDTKKGDQLPLGVLTADQLIGRRIEIRKDGNVELVGEVPPFGLPKKPQKAEDSFEAQQSAPQPDMKGTLELRSKADKGQERIILTVKKVDFDDGPFDVFVEDGVATGNFEKAGDLERLSKHKGRFRRDCKQGEALPGGVMFVSELAGRVIQVRDHDDDIFIETVIPAVK
jgi:hypothetical protein